MSEQGREQHARLYKNEGRTLQDGRRKREEEGIQLRREKRDDQLAKRRNLGASSNNGAGQMTSDSDSSDVSSPHKSATPVMPVDSKESDAMFLETYVKSLSSPQNAGRQITDTLVHALRSRDDHQVVRGAAVVRKLLSKEPSPPIDEVIKSGILADIIRLLHRQDNKEIQFEACWAVTNIASGTSDQTRALVEGNALRPLFAMISAEWCQPEVREQAVWALGNIAGDCNQYRDLLLAMGVMHPLVAILDSRSPEPSLSMRRNVVWTMSNLNRNKSPSPAIELVAPCIPALARCLMANDDIEVLTDCCWAFSYIGDGDNDRIQLLTDAGIAPKLSLLLTSPNWHVVAAAIRAIGNIVTGDDRQTQTVLDSGALVRLRGLLDAGKDQIVKETCWTISNVTAGNTDQIQACFEANLFEPLIRVATQGEFKSRREAVWALSNAASGGTSYQVARLVSFGSVEALCSALAINDSRLITTVLQALEQMLKTGVRMALELGYAGNNDFNDGELAANPVAICVEECGGLDRIEALQSHENINIYKRALHLIEKYFGEDDVSDEYALSPDVVGGVFQFANGRGNSHNGHNGNPGGGEGQLPSGNNHNNGNNGNNDNNNEGGNGHAFDF